MKATRFHRHLPPICVALTALLVLHELTLLPNGTFHVHFLDVSQGDSALLITPSGKQVLVDGGPDMSTLEHLGKHMPFFDRSLDLIVLTHPHDDHLASLTEVFRRHRINNALLAGTEAGSPRYHSLISEISNQRTPVMIADPSQDIDLGDGVILDIVWPEPNERNKRNPNNSSVVIRALYKEESILLTGDVEEAAEKNILLSGADIRSNVLKAAHHGSRTSSSTGFLLAIGPQRAIISASGGNEFGHPHEETLRRLETLHIPTSTTALDGSISLVFR